MAYKVYAQNTVETGSTQQPSIQMYIKNVTDTVNRRLYMFYPTNGNADRIPRWPEMTRMISSSGGTIPGGPITSIPVLTFNPGTNLKASDWIIATFYASQPPTALLTGGTVNELTASNVTHSLSWVYGRQSATATISTAVINPGSFNVFGSQPTQPGTISGGRSVTTTANTNTTYTLTVTTSDGKSATSSTTDTFLPRFYYGRSSSATPNSTIILAFAGGGNPLTGGKAQTSILITSSGSNYPFFSYPSSEGAINNIFDVNGFNVTNSFNQTTVSVTNTQGYNQNYFVYTLNAATSSSYTLTSN